ncbi:hypothetical protein JCM17960_07850 [Magnetospira thiophila]
MAVVVTQEEGTKPRFMAALSYLGILCFVPLVMNRDDEFVYFHAKQGLVIWMWGVLALFALHMPGAGKWFFSFSVMAVLGFSLLGLVSVMFNKAWNLPFIGYLASKL